jgi:predicted NBD/HSP70 family sugar kinase
MYFLFDIGGTNMRFAVSNGKDLGDSVTVSTPQDYPTAIKLFQQAFTSLTRPGQVKLAVGGVPRLVQDKLTFWYTKPAQKAMEKICGCRVIMENDAMLAGLAEANLGAGAHQPIVGFLTYSSGFGGSRIVDGLPDKNAFGFEPKLQIDNFNPSDKHIKSISDYVSGRGLKRATGQPAKFIKNKKLWQEVEKWIAVTVNDAATFWSPDVVVIGGPIALDPVISQARIQKFINQRFKAMPKIPVVKKGRLGQKAGLLGAMILANQKRP